MAFFGPGGLAGRSESGLDPQLLQALLAQFPGLQGLQGQPGGQEQPRSLMSLGYQGQGPQLFQGQGTSAFTLSPFEGAKGFGAESITGGLAQGTFGKSASQTPFGGAPAANQNALLSLPSLTLPMAQVAAAQGGYGGDTMAGSSMGGQEDGGISVSAGDILGAGQDIAGLFAPGTGTAFDPGQQTQQLAYQAQRAGERDLSTLGGSFLGATSASGAFPYVQTPTLSIEQAMANPSDLTFSTMPSGGAAPSETMFAPGGPASSALGPEGGALPQGDLLGGGLSTLQGLYSLYGGTQTGDIGQLLSGGAGTLGGLGQMAPGTAEALSQWLGLGTGGLGLAASGLGGLAGGYGLYQGIQQGDPLQALMGAGSLYAGAAPLANAALGTTLPTLSSLGSSALSAIGGGTAAGTGAAASSAGAGIGATAGGLGAGATAGIIALPMIAAYLGVSIDDMLSADRAASREAARQQRFQRGLPTITQDIMGGADLMSQLTPDATDEQLLKAYEQLETVERNWEGGPATGNPLAPSFPTMIGGMSDAGRTTREQIDPYLAQVGLGRLRAEDLMRQRGLAIPGGGRFTPELAAKLLGGASSAYDPESGSYLGMPAYRSTNPWMQRNFLDPSRQQYELAQNVFNQTTGPGGEAIRDISTFDPGIQTQLQGIDLSRAPDARTISAWSPEATQAFRGFQPGGMEAGVRQLLGLPALKYGNAPQVATEQYGALTIPSFSGASLEEQQNRFNATPQGQYAQQFQSALDQFMAQQTALTQQAPKLLQGFQSSLQGAPIPQEMAMAGAPQAGGGGIDLEALLRQLGYLR